MADFLLHLQPVTYDLFSIVIHVGAAACGGHYHAYIKDPYGYTGGNMSVETGKVNASSFLKKYFYYLFLIT